MPDDFVLAPHEERDVNSRFVIGAGCGLLVIIGIVFLVVWLLINLLGAGMNLSSSTTTAQPTPPAPRLQVAPEEEYQHLKATQESILNSYAWVDQGKGVARIPIDRAMELVVTQLAQSPTPEATADATPGQDTGGPNAP